MKRYKYFDKEKSITLYQAIYDIDNLRLAHKNASRGKQWYKEVQKVNQDLDTYLYKLQKMFIDKTYKTSEYTVFTKKEHDKERTIYKLPYFPDRIAQWAIIQIIRPIIEKQFISTTFSSIKGRGQLSCANSVSNALWTDKNMEYCLKLDIKKFYSSIDHSILKERYKKIFKDQDLLWIIDEIIDSVPDNEGVPIGNFLSQYSGNLFLSPLDHYCKEVLGIKHYFRYMDDIVILGDNKDLLRNQLKKIQKWVRDNKLELKSNYQIFPINSRGIDFVGYRIFKGFRLIRKRTIKTFKKKLKSIRKNLNYHSQCVLFSYMGIFKWGDAYRFIQKYCQEVIKFLLINERIKQNTVPPMILY